MKNANKSASSNQIMALSWLGNTPTHWYQFTGKIVRFEADGFGIIEFDNPIGTSSNTIGIVTSSTTAISPLTSLRPGARVEGMADADERTAASIKTFQLVPRFT
jgi:hypothetical protein